MGRVVILGVFVADTAYRARRQPKIGETILGEGFALGPGGKGSNQAVAAARAGAEVHMVTRLGQDAFAQMALDVWQDAGVTPAVTRHADGYTGAAYIFIDAASGDNAIIIAPGVGRDIAAADIDARADLIGAADVFVTQLEQPIDAAMHGLRLARAKGVKTILNPAPAVTLPEGMLALCDWVTPNETEAAALTGLPVASVAEAEAAGRALLSLGARGALVTLGARGVMLVDGSGVTHLPALDAGPVVETTGAGDAFNGGFAAALAEGMAPPKAARFGCATAAISVTRPGTAPSMPARSEILALLGR